MSGFVNHFERYKPGCSKVGHGHTSCHTKRGAFSEDVGQALSSSTVDEAKKKEVAGIADRLKNKEVWRAVKAKHGSDMTMLFSGLKGANDDADSFIDVLHQHKDTLAQDIQEAEQALQVEKTQKTQQAQQKASSGGGIESGLLNGLGMLFGLGPLGMFNDMGKMMGQMTQMGGPDAFNPEKMLEKVMGQMGKAGGSNPFNPEEIMKKTFAANLEMTKEMQKMERITKLREELGEEADDIESGKPDELKQLSAKSTILNLQGNIKELIKQLPKDQRIAFSGRLATENKAELEKLRGEVQDKIDESIESQEDSVKIEGLRTEVKSLILSLPPGPQRKDFQTKYNSSKNDPQNLQDLKEEIELAEVEAPEKSEGEPDFSQIQSEITTLIRALPTAQIAEKTKYADKLIACTKLEDFRRLKLGLEVLQPTE